MPQMSPLMWVVLMFFFTLFYLIMGLSVYYNFYGWHEGGIKSSTCKFLIFLG